MTNWKMINFCFRVSKKGLEVPADVCLIKQGRVYRNMCLVYKMQDKVRKQAKLMNHTLVHGLELLYIYGRHKTIVQAKSTATDVDLYLDRIFAMQ